LTAKEERHERIERNEARRRRRRRQKMEMRAKLLADLNILPPNASVIIQETTSIEIRAAPTAGKPKEDL